MRDVVQLPKYVATWGLGLLGTGLLAFIAMGVGVYVSVQSITTELGYLRKEFDGWKSEQKALAVDRYTGTRGSEFERETRAAIAAARSAFEQRSDTLSDRIMDVSTNAQTGRESLAIADRLILDKLGELRERVVSLEATQDRVTDKLDIDSK